MIPEQEKKEEEEFEKTFKQRFPEPILGVRPAITIKPEHDILHRQWESCHLDALWGWLERAKISEKGMENCNICGGRLIVIRGRYPGDPRREVCATCLQEKLERIYDETSPEAWNRRAT